MRIDSQAIRTILLAAWAHLDPFPEEREAAHAFLVGALDAYLIEHGDALARELADLERETDQIARLEHLLNEQFREPFRAYLDRSLKCEKCGTRYAVGEDYRCPHGKVSRGGVIDDTLPGGARWMHNLGDTPVWVETKTDYSRELSSRGLRQAERGTYNRDDRSPWATRTRLRPGARDPFVR